MADAIAEVQADAIEAARARRMPATVAQWKALAATIAARWAIDRLREAEANERYDAGLCEDPDAYLRPTLYWEHRDPIDTKRYLAVLKELFDSGQMPEHGAEILWGEAEEVPHAETAAELGISEGLVRKRLFRMRQKFRARIASLGLLTLVLLLFLSSLLTSVGSVSAPNPGTPAPEVDPQPPARCLPVPDAGLEAGREKSTGGVERNRALSD